MRIHSPANMLTVRLRYPDKPGFMGLITTCIGHDNASVGAVDIVDVGASTITRDFTINANDAEHGDAVIKRLRELENVEVLSASDRTFLLHLGGKLEMRAKSSIRNRDDLSMVYTPGVARICRAIYDDPEAVFNLTIRRNTVAVVTDGSAVLGMGNIGPKAAMPVMEGKAVLFKEFGGVDAFPICLDTQNVDEIVNPCRYLAPTFGGINLEDISAPRCVEIEQRLVAELDIPVFHDDQHGTAIVVLAALKNSLKLTGLNVEGLRVTINGAGVAGVAIAKLLTTYGVRQLVVCDRLGAIHAGRSELNPAKQWLAAHTNPDRKMGRLGDVIQDSHVFIGVSAPDVLTLNDIKSMSSNRIVFALANPDPEVEPELAEPHVSILATGRSDSANQINSVLCFPGLFRGVLDVRATTVTDDMKLAAAEAIASVIPNSDLRPDYVVPSVFDQRVVRAVAEAVAQAAVTSGVARRKRKADDTNGG